MAKEKLFAVFGLGTFGLEVCKQLAARGGKVIAIDRQENIIDKIKDDVTQAMLLDCTDEEALHNAGLNDVDVAIVSVGDNIHASVLTTALLKNIGIPYIIARAVSDIHAQVLKQIGATEVLNLEIEEGQRLAKKLLTPNVLDLIPVSKHQSIAEVRVPKQFVGKSLLQLNVRKEFNVNIITIKRSVTSIDDMGNPVKEETVIAPTAHDILQINDILIVLGSEKDIDSLKDR